MRSAKPPAHLSLVTSIMCSWESIQSDFCSSLKRWSFHKLVEKYHVFCAALSQVRCCQGFVDVAHHMGPVLRKGKRYFLNQFWEYFLHFSHWKFQSEFLWCANMFHLACDLFDILYCYAELNTEPHHESVVKIGIDSFLCISISNK